MNAYGYFEKGKLESEGYRLVWPSSSLSEASEKFAEIAKLSLQDFHQIYGVERVDMFKLLKNDRT